MLVVMSSHPFLNIESVVLWLSLYISSSVVSPFLVSEFCNIKLSLWLCCFLMIISDRASPPSLLVRCLDTYRTYLVAITS